MAGPESPFVELPAALVDEVLAQTAEIGDRLLASFRSVREGRARFRGQLVEAGLVTTETALGYPPLPTTCATDGSYAIDRLLSVDLVAAAAVAVEGLTPPSEKRYWENPHHTTFVAPEPHHAETATILRAVMLGNELRLATSAPHDLVMIDGSLTLPVIYFNQALNQAPGLPSLRCSQEFLGHALGYLEAYRALLRGERSDRQYVALPKYSTHREIGAELGWPEGQDDRGLLTLILMPGELTRPRRLAQPGQEWHLYTSRLPKAAQEEAAALVSDIVDGLGRIHIFYYKPQEWLPALRVEVPESIALNPHRLATVVQGLRHQCATSAMLEPYPLYLADRTVKALARALPAFRQVATQRVSERYEGDIGEVFFALHGYRSESGA
jgi:hypothetical protein